MKTIKTYMKLLLALVCALFIGAVAHSVFADDLLFQFAETEYQNAFNLKADSDARTAKLEQNMAKDIEAIKAEYAPYFKDEKKINNHAKQLLCEKEKVLAGEKMQAFKDDKIELTEADTVRLSEKMLWKCEEEKVAVVEDIKIEAYVEDLDRIAYAGSIAETSGCTEGKGVSNNNCFGIKNGSIAPCEKMDAGRFCIYETTEDSFEAFKKIWAEGYGGGYPTYKMAKVWTGNDSPDTWLSNFADAYNNYPNV